MKSNIMFVADSVSGLDFLRGLLQDEAYHFFAFGDPFDALDKMKELEFTVVIADQSISKMDVIEFFKKVKQQSPHTVGIILTSYFKRDKALDALNNGLIYRFIKKPSDDFGIKQAVKMAIAHRKIDFEFS